MLRENFRPRSKLVVKQTQVKRAKFPVIDAHNHLGEPFGGGWDKKPLPELLDLLDEAGIAHYVDLDSSGATLRVDLVLESITPDAATVKTTLTNAGKLPLSFDRFDAPQLVLSPLHLGEGPGRRTELVEMVRALWTLQGAAVTWGQDFAFELPRGFARDNFLGHLQDGEGGGIPVVYFWNKIQGVALMHIEPTPKNWYIPVKSGKEGVTAALQLRQPVTLQPGESFF